MTRVVIPRGHIVYDGEGVARGEGETLDVSAKAARELQALWDGPAASPVPEAAAIVNDEE